MSPDEVMSAIGEGTNEKRHKRLTKISKESKVCSVTIRKHNNL